MEKSKVVRIIVVIIVIIIGCNLISGDKYDTTSAIQARTQAEYSMGKGFSEDEIDFDIVDSKKDEKFIIKIKAKSKDAKSVYKELYGTDTVYYAYSSGYGGTYSYALSDSKGEAKDKIGW